MGVIFISNPKGATPAGFIVLWSGNKATIPVGWEYYSEAAGYSAYGATSANISPLGAANHNHDYSGATGNAGGHTHSVSLSQSEPVDLGVLGVFVGVTTVEAAARYHDNHPVSRTVSTVGDHNHGLNNTEDGSNVPPSMKLYFIRKT